MAAGVRERLFRRWVWRLPPGSASVALTFDDGPDPNTTPRLLDELQRLGIASTHFVVGENAAAAPDLLRDIARHGHVLANHAYHHESFRLRSESHQRENVHAADQVIWQATGIRSVFFRPCFGQFNPFTQPALEGLGHIGVLWSVIAADWMEQDDELLWHKLQSRLHKGAIIVLHDGHPTTPRVVRLLPRLAAEVHSRGWTFVPLSPSLLISSGNDI